MRCSNCGMDNIVNDAVHCPNCGASLLSPGNWDSQSSAPQQQYQQPPPGPQPQYQQPQQYYPPAPAKTARVPTVINIGATEILFLFFGLFLIAAGFQNFSVIGRPFWGFQYPLLGIIAILAGLFVMAANVMPKLLVNMHEILDHMMLALSLLFLFWGFGALFLNNVGLDGELLIAGALAGLAGFGLKMGYLK